MDGITFEVDTAGLFAALDKLGADAERLVKEASKQTADRIVVEAQARLQRTLGPQSTGETLAGIKVLDDKTGTGYLVVSGNARMPNLPLWLEKGTKGGRRMAPRRYFYTAAFLEEAPHRRRIEEAIMAAIEASGLGE